MTISMNSQFCFILFILFLILFITYRYVSYLSSEFIYNYILFVYISNIYRSFEYCKGGQNIIIMPPD